MASTEHVLNLDLGQSPQQDPGIEAQNPWSEEQSLLKLKVSEAQNCQAFVTL